MIIRLYPIFIRTMRRIYTLYLALLYLPDQSIAQSTSIEVPLQVIDRYLPKGYSQVGTNQSTDLTGFQGIPDYLVEKVIRSSNTVRGQTQFEAYLNGKITKAEWEKSKATFGSDTLALSSAPLRQRINSLVGTDKQGRRVVIVDANNNQNFGDDRALYYPMTLPAIERNKDGLYMSNIHAVYDTLPAIKVQVEAFDGKKVIPRFVWIKPNPFNDGWTYINPSENQFHLALLAHEYRKGTVTLLGQSLYFTVTTLPGALYNSQSARVVISQDSLVFSTANSNDSYRIGQSFILNNRLIQITDLSIQGDRLYLTDIGSAGNLIAKPQER